LEPARSATLFANSIGLGDRVDAMSDEQLRELVAGEHPTVVEAAEAIIARRQAVERAVS
jgi:hypothetical protein